MRHTLLCIIHYVELRALKGTGILVIFFEEQRRRRLGREATESRDVCSLYCGFVK